MVPPRAPSFEGGGLSSRFGESGDRKDLVPALVLSRALGSERGRLEPGAFPHALEQRKAESNERLLVAGPLFQHRVPSANGHIDRRHLDVHELLDRFRS